MDGVFLPGARCTVPAQDRPADITKYLQRAARCVQQQAAGCACQRQQEKHRQRPYPPSRCESEDARSTRRGAQTGQRGQYAAAVQDTPGAALLFHVPCLPVLRAFLTE